MNNCPTVHEHPEFKKSFQVKNKNQNKEVEKLKDRLLSHCHTQPGEYLKYDFVPFKSFPRGHNPIRCLFILCRDCKKQAINPVCDFCGAEKHSMDDAVLFYISEHDKAYKKEGLRIIKEYKAKSV